MIIIPYYQEISYERKNYSKKRITEDHFRFLYSFLVLFSVSFFFSFGIYSTRIMWSHDCSLKIES